jgi:hypothetical protein
VPLGVDTTTSTVPAACAGLTAVICVSELTTKRTAAVPKATPVAPVKLLPVMTTRVPPAVLPLPADREVTAGAGAAA